VEQWWPRRIGPMVQQLVERKLAAVSAADMAGHA
jgi:hypothetical protein